VAGRRDPQALQIDLEIITLGHTVDSAFQQALAAAWDPLGNLDHDPTLTTRVCATRWARSTRGCRCA